MKVFLSWSGVRSNRVAALFNGWVKGVLQALDPWISSEDIDPGTIWFNEIGDRVKETSVGIVFLTRENLNKPWILFEAGALSRGLSSQRVMTFLIDLKESDLAPPLANFNATYPKREGIQRLVKGLNDLLGAGRLEDKILESVFDLHWPLFQKEFDQILTSTKEGDPVEKRTVEEMLEELLDRTRRIEMRAGNDGESRASLRTRLLLESRKTKRAEQLSEATKMNELLATISTLRAQGIQLNELIETLTNLGYLNEMVRDAIHLAYSGITHVADFPGPLAKSPASDDPS